MNLMADQMQKAHLVISVLLCFSIQMVLYAQDTDYVYLSNTEYEVINDLFSNPKSIEKNHLKLYFKTDFDREWRVYFNVDNKDLLYELPNFGTLKNEELESVLMGENRVELLRSINQLRPYSLENKKIRNIPLSKSFDSEKDLAYVWRISKPIIIGDYAFLKRMMMNEGNFLILHKKEKWEVVRVFYVWNTLY